MSFTVVDIKMEKEIFRDIGWIAREINATANRTLRPFNLGDNRFIYVIRVLEQPGIGQQELATTIGVDRTTAFRAVSKLIADGYLEKRDHPAQPRLKVLYPTAKSQQMKQQLFDFEAASSQRYLDVLTPDELASLQTLLARVRHHAQTNTEPF